MTTAMWISAAVWTALWALTGWPVFALLAAASTGGGLVAWWLPLSRSHTDVMAVADAVREQQTRRHDDDGGGR